ncbi:uncharacterized protein LOC105803106 isoform X2 [Gossypium raimondii]|uniref:uncharacterized protein LOC105803106 isoform X2 n=1 Tax=Gossypium raimondii TaxID=29730 RepID=UPI00227C6728|nr:uncharacterized protein LOC105803106 isoform X2 [Gossypium raimondii]XP_052479019.1 uncharacterized protein LOC105803106 isoform X2 [Gossypium raimondii]XP_052479020.1 uncharacterized protein LOC105803106 isoform X2 [Gossypium raimondii]
MGKKPIARKRQGKGTTAMPKDPSGGVEKQPESSNPLSQNAILQPKKRNPPFETVESQPKTQTNSADLSSLTKVKKHGILYAVRRSERLQAVISPSQDKEIERLIDEITLSEGEKDEVPLDHEDGELPQPIQTQMTMEEKFDYLFQQIEELQKTLETLKFKATRDSSPTGSPRAADVRYRNLYFESQKKIEALTNENHQLALKLERALGKLEAEVIRCCVWVQYDNGACAASEGLQKMKEMILVANLTRSTETAVNFSTQTFPSMDGGAEAMASLRRKKPRTGK